MDSTEIGQAENMGLQSWHIEESWVDYGRSRPIAQRVLGLSTSHPIAAELA